MSLTISPNQASYALNTEYPLREFLLTKELPQRGAILRISSSDNVSNQTRTRHIVLSHFNDAFGIAGGSGNPVNIRRIFGLEFHIEEEFLQLLREGENFRGRFAVADTSEQEDGTWLIKTFYMISVVSNNYFADLGTWFRQVEVSLPRRLPSSLISLIQEYAPYELCDFVSTTNVDISSDSVVTAFR